MASIVMRMPNVSATGVTVRHAVSRALATANLAPREATYKVLSARAWAGRDRSIGRAEVFLSVDKPRPLPRWELHEIEGWVNPDGEHPLMTLVRLDDPLFVDVVPVTWDRWLQHRDERLPDNVDPLCPVTGLDRDRAGRFAEELGMRLPTASEYQAIWGAERFPWGDRRDLALGRHAPPRFGAVHEVGAHPPVRGLSDIGAWLWHHLADGGYAGALHQGHPGFGVEDVEGPIGFRCVLDAG